MPYVSIKDRRKGVVGTELSNSDNNFVRIAELSALNRQLSEHSRLLEKELGSVMVGLDALKEENTRLENDNKALRMRNAGAMKITNEIKRTRDAYKHWYNLAKKQLDEALQSKPPPQRKFKKVTKPQLPGVYYYRIPSEDMFHIVVVVADDKDMLIASVNMGSNLIHESSFDLYAFIQFDSDMQQIPVDEMPGLWWGPLPSPPPIGEKESETED